MAAVVAAEGVVKTYGEGRAARRVLDGASLHVQPGEVVAILGRSGTGKSTLLHLIGGLDRPEAGTISVAGERGDGRERARAVAAAAARGSASSSSSSTCCPSSRGEANVLLAGRVRGASPGRARARGQELIDRLGLRDGGGLAPAPALRRRAAALRDRAGAGQRPGRAAADEPTGNLDVGAGAEVLRLLRAGADEGRAVVMVTHEAAAADIADRVLTLRDGRLDA